MMPRTGTNFLANALYCHPQVAGSEPIHEDFLLRHVDRLGAYCRRTSKHWNPRWDAEGTFLSPDVLLSHLGDGLETFLVNPVRSRQLGDNIEAPAPRIIVTKTPSVQNLRHFFRVFAKASIVLLVRDGRSVVESGCRSFDWDFDMAARNWRLAATEILAFLEANPDERHRTLLVDYESLFADTAGTVERILHFLGVDPKQADYGAINALHVSGSSESRRTAEAVDWKPAKKNANFNPVARHEGWSRGRRRRFEWLAGDQLQALGYIDELERFSVGETARQRILDLSWPIRALPRTLWYLLRERKLILNSR